MNQVDVDWPFHTFLKPPAVKEGINVHLQPLSVGRRPSSSTVRLLRGCFEVSP